MRKSISIVARMLLSSGMSASRSQLRAQDFYLYEPSGDYYWDSEYFYAGQPAKFRCSFLIHLEPGGSSTTKVEIFEYQPTIWVGEYLGMSAHAILPTMLHDIRSAESTTVDRKNLLGTDRGGHACSKPLANVKRRPPEARVREAMLLNLGNPSSIYHTVENRTPIWPILVR